MRTLTEEERRKIRMDIQWLVESIKPASAGGGYSSKSVGEAMDRIIAIIDRLTAPEPQSFEIGPDKTSSIEPKAVFGDATGNSIASVQGQDRSKPTPAAMGKSGPSHEAIRNAIWRNKHDFNAVAEQVLALIGRG